MEQINNDVIELKDEVFGTSSEDLQVSIVDGNFETKILPFAENTHYVTNYNDAKGTLKDNATKIVKASLAIKLANNTDHNVKLFSIFPGNMNESINSSSRGRYTTSDYVTNNLNVYIKTHKRNDNNVLGEVKIPQYYNQYLYFRVVDIYNNKDYYSNNNQYNNNDVLG